MTNMDGTTFICVRMAFLRAVLSSQTSHGAGIPSTAFWPLANGGRINVLNL